MGGVNQSKGRTLENRCAAHLFDFNEDAALTLDKFFSNYHRQFPMLAVIVDGHYGETIYDCFENFQIFRIHGYTTQPRIVCTDRKSAQATCESYYTIPVRNNYGFQKVKSHKSVGEVQSLTDILAENKLPMMVKFGGDPARSIKVDSWPLTCGDIGNLLIRAKYDEHFMMVNCIDTIKLRMNNTSCIMALSKNLTATPVLGFKYKSDDEFHAFLRQLDEQAATSGEVYDKNRGNPGASSADSDSDGDYEEILEPPKLPDHIPKTQVTNQTTSSSPDDSKQSPKEPKSGKKAGFFDRFHKKSKENSASKDSTPKEKETKPVVKAGHVSPRVFHRVGGSSSDVTDDPPDFPKKPSADDLGPMLDAPPPRPRKPSAGAMNAEQAGKQRSESGYANKPLPNALVRPMVKEGISPLTIPPLTDDRRPQPLPAKQATEESEGFGESGQTYDDVYEILQVQEGEEEIYSPSDYIEVPSKFSNLKIKCSRHSQDVTVRARSPSATPTRPPAADTHSPTTATRIPAAPTRQPAAVTRPVAAESDRDATTADNVKPRIEAVKEEIKAFDITALSISEVADILKTLRLDKYIEEFADNQIDGDILSQLSVEDMVAELGLKKLEAIRLSRYAESGHVPK